ncbi:patatin family protein [Aliidiomarina minuta]|uniref:Patatin family protein n=1 Tax=Aliidiomarina minuta TaxID=880057 RepID=A0A432W3Q5_9GAMM|nr:patatin family protein [Aliidiomarina minuta]RUO23990.1 patatin family protein [Aliidiomarina minuta]
METKQNKRALVIEGGAMRGIFAAGVLDAFIDADFFAYDFVIGVSAGSTNAIGYLAGDRGRSYQVLTDHALRKDFMNFKRYALGGHLCDVNWLWQASRRDIALNVEGYIARGIPLYVVTTSVKTGHPRYHKVDLDNLDQVFPASCAIPVFFKDHPAVDGEPMSDGGMGDSIPVLEAYKRGARDITVLRSVPLSYRKEPIRYPSMLKPLFAQHPRLLGAALRRQRKYAKAIAFIENPPSDCRVSQIAPPEEFPVSRFTRSIHKLDTGYEQGLNAASSYLQEKSCDLHEVS